MIPIKKKRIGAYSTHLLNRIYFNNTLLKLVNIMPIRFNILSVPPNNTDAIKTTIIIGASCIAIVRHNINNHILKIKIIKVFILFHLLSL
jgi:hypothetical protein